MSYEKLIAIDKLNFKDKKVLILGAGWMANQFCKALFNMGVKDVSVISRKEESARKCCENYHYKPFWDGYEKTLPSLGKFDLVIVATNIESLKAASDFAVKCGNNNILVEKPGTLHSKIFRQWAKEAKDNGARIRIAYNRFTYPSLWKAKELSEKDGGITSCTYTFTEWIHTMDFNKNKPEVYERWGIANSLHVISMAHHLIGMPKELTSYASGGLPWHPSGERFAGCGISKKGALFSYLADWKSAGRWGIEIMTPGGAYRLIPLEKLFHCPKGSVNWTPIELKCAYPDVKEGIAEELAVMLKKELEDDIPLATLEYAADLTSLAEKILSYTE